MWLDPFLKASSDLVSMPSPCDLGQVTLDEPLLLGTLDPDVVWCVAGGITCGPAGLALPQSLCRRAPNGGTLRGEDSDV